MTQALLQTKPSTQKPAIDKSGAERRNSRRMPRAQPVWWRGYMESEISTGLLIERSEKGAVFLSRGTVQPMNEMRIMLSITDPFDSSAALEPALVRRVTHVHGDLFLVAAEFAGPTIGPAHVS